MNRVVLSAIGSASILVAAVWVMRLPPESAEPKEMHALQAQADAEGAVLQAVSDSANLQTGESHPEGKTTNIESSAAKVSDSDSRDRASPPKRNWVERDFPTIELSAASCAQDSDDRYRLETALSRSQPTSAVWLAAAIRLADCDVDSGRLDRAQELLDTARKHHPDDIPSLLIASEAAQKNGRHLEAERLASEALKRIAESDLSSAEAARAELLAYSRLSDSLAAQGLDATEARQAAVDARERLAQAAPLAEQAGIWMGVARARLDSGDTNGAINAAQRGYATYQDAVAAGHSFDGLEPFLLVSLGEVLYRSGQQSVGSAYMEQGLSRAGGDDPNIQMLRAIVDATLGDQG